jgi:hypothetical protein
VIKAGNFFPNVNSQLNEMQNHLLNNFQKFLIDDGHSRSINAGYHWFNDQKRYFFSLRLCLVVTNYSLADKIIESLKKQGINPNISPVNFNSIDLTLCLWATYTLLETH